MMFRYLIFLHIFFRALGQGAFGEVYQGFFKHRAGDAVEMPVAVKVPTTSVKLFVASVLLKMLIILDKLCKGSSLRRSGVSQCHDTFKQDL